MMLLFVFAGQMLASLSGWLNSLDWVIEANLWFDLGFNLGFGTLLIAHITFDIPYVILSVMPKLRQPRTWAPPACTPSARLCCPKSCPAWSTAPSSPLP